MPMTLTANQVRVIASLMEKSVITPDQYPLTLNALTSACNQKSARNPVMSLQQGVVQHTIRDLEAKHLVRIEENFKSRAERYVQRFCNTRFSDYQFDPPQFAVVCLLMLRGPQTPGELRAHSGRLHGFPDNAAVVDTLNSLIEREGDPLVMQLPRTPGRRDAEYAHLFSGPVELERHAGESRPMSPARARPQIDRSDLEERLRKLEAQVADLREQLKARQS